MRNQQQRNRLADRVMGGGRRSGKTIFSSMSAEPHPTLLPAKHAIGLFGNDIANPYD
jgi:hypothetical protein